jgi:hypothetical protein
MTTGVALWVVTGGVTSVLAPFVVVVTRRWIPYDRLRVPVGAIAVSFIVLHGAITLSLLARPQPWLWVLLHLCLLAGAVIYWAPVLRVGRRLSGLAPFLYLFFTSPFLDFAGLGIMALGDPRGGVAMIAAMLPVNAMSLIVLWQWMVTEDRMADQFATLPPNAGGTLGKADG